MPAAKLSTAQIAGISVACIILALALVCVGVSFYPFSLKPEEILKLYQLMKDVDEVLCKNNIPYVVESGTLLGCVRHGGMIPWDDDLDIQILKQDEAAFLALRPLFKNLQYDIRRANFGYKIMSASGFPFCDVFITSFDDKSCSHNKNHSFEKCFFKWEEYYPIKRYKFGEIEVNGPTNPDFFLDRCYGKSWRDTWYLIGSHKFRYFHIPRPKKMKPDDYKHAVPTGPLQDRVK